MSLETESLQGFLDNLASSAATPGGGSAAAINGAMGAALVSMVCNLTIGKKKYAAVEAEMTAILAQSEALRHNLIKMMAEDVAAFDAVMAAYKLPRASDEEKAARKAAIETATKEATRVPLKAARACAEVIALSKPTAEMGNRNVISDAGVGAMSALSGLQSAALNVYINLGALQDRDFAAQAEAELNEILAGQETLASEVYALVKAKL
jgi:formiminotetrahydrofolate cyclodeaminase